MSNILTDLVTLNARNCPDREAFSDNTTGPWIPTTWKRVATLRDRLACALKMLGINVQDNIAVFTANRSEILLIDFAAYANRAVPVSLYATSSSDQVSYILRDCSARLIFVGDQRQYAKARRIKVQCPDLQRIVTIDKNIIPDLEDTETISLTALFKMGRDEATDDDRAEVARRTAAALPEDIATIIYTSGTTGEPKGAVLPHSCFTAALLAHDRRLTMLSEKDTSVCFLPLSHIFEKAWTYYCLHRCMKVGINHDPHNIQSAVHEFQPTCMCSVPRFWEKVYTAVQEQLSSYTGFKRWLSQRALAIGRRYNLDYVRNGRKVPALLKWQYGFYDRHVFATMRSVIGIPYGNIFPTAGAPISSEIVEFFRSCGIPIVIGYGLSETTATVTCFPNEGYEIGSVGTPLPEVDVKIGENNEILVKGPTVMSGYYNKPEATAEAFTADGWFRTGDAGRFDESGALFLTERIKDLFKTSNGKYIAPQAIESLLAHDKYFEQVAVIGDQRKFVSALIVPNYEALKKYAAERSITYKSIDDLVENPEIRSLIQERLDTLQRKLAPYERIKKFILLPKEFTMENGELTNTLKIKRPVINERYAELIDSMYDL